MPELIKCGAKINKHRRYWGTILPWDWISCREKEEDAFAIDIRVGTLDWESGRIPRRLSTPVNRLRKSFSLTFEKTSSSDIGRVVLGVQIDSFFGNRMMRVSFHLVGTFDPSHSDWLKICERSSQYCFWKSIKTLSLISRGPSCDFLFSYSDETSSLTSSSVQNGIFSSTFSHMTSGASVYGCGRNNRWLLEQLLKIICRTFGYLFRFFRYWAVVSQKIRVVMPSMPSWTSWSLTKKRYPTVKRNYGFWWHGRGVLTWTLWALPSLFFLRHLTMFSSSTSFFLFNWKDRARVWDM